MHKLDAVGMKAHTPDRIHVGTIFQVAHYGVLQILHVHTNLVLAPCFQFQFYQRVFLRALQRAVVRDGVFSTVVVVRCRANAR